MRRTHNREEEQWLYIIDFEGSGSCVDGHEQTLDMCRHLKKRTAELIWWLTIQQLDDRDRDSYIMTSTGHDKWWLLKTWSKDKINVDE